MSISVSNLTEQIAGVMDAFKNATYDSVMEASNLVGKETVDELKTHLTAEIGGTGEYVESFVFTPNVYSSGVVYRGVVHCEKPHYRLTHLLEYGHATRNGGRTRAFPHFAPAEEFASKRILEVLPQIIERNTK